MRQFIRTLLLALTVTLLGDLPTDAQAQATQCSTVSGELQSACYKCQQQGMLFSRLSDDMGFCVPRVGPVPQLPTAMPAPAVSAPYGEAAINRYSASPAPPSGPGKLFRDCADCPEMVVIPAGSFDMGSPSYETGRDSDEEPMHRVSVKRFALGKTHLTRGEFASFISQTGYQTGGSCSTFAGGKWEDRQGILWKDPGFPQDDSHPVVCVNWNDAKAYVDWLSRKTGQNYRLPSEAEWEYAARAGTTTARYWGESPDLACHYANVGDSTLKRQVTDLRGETHNCSDGYAYTSPGARFAPNAFGLYDVIGNALEWTEDCVNGNYVGAPNDGSAWLTGNCTGRVLRGGSWINVPRYARSAIRSGITASGRFTGIGFRIARMIP